MVVYTLEQRWEILQHYFENHGNVAECVKIAKEFWKGLGFFLVQRNEINWHPIDKPKRENPKTVRSPENIAAVAENVYKAPSMSIHHRSQ